MPTRCPSRSALVQAMAMTMLPSPTFRRSSSTQSFIMSKLCSSVMSKHTIAADAFLTFEGGVSRIQGSHETVVNHLEPTVSSRPQAPRNQSINAAPEASVLTYNITDPWLGIAPGLRCPIFAS